MEQEDRILKRAIIYSADKKYSLQLAEYECFRETKVDTVSTQSELILKFEDNPCELVFIDIDNMPSQEMNIVSYIKIRNSFTNIIILASPNNLEKAGSYLKYGAAFYLLKPLGCDLLRSVIDKTIHKFDNDKKLRRLEETALSDLMTGSREMQSIFKKTMKIAPTDSTVILNGESGTGKEFFAKILHRMSHRSEGKFVTVNCGAIPPTLFESELFGYKKGAFTGADRDKEGLVEIANMGTLFLDEIGELPLADQVKLLRFIQEKTFMRVGDPKQRSVSVRIIAATNRNLKKMVEKGTFREDLYYRLNIFSITLPPLRKRKETIPNLIKLFVHKYNMQLNKKVSSISKTAEVILARYNYPGNVRELENIMEHAVVLSDGEFITEADLPEFMFPETKMLEAPQSESIFSEKPATVLPLDEVEKRHISDALKIFDYNYSETAKALNISRSTLWRKMKSYNIEEKK